MWADRTRVRPAFSSPPRSRVAAVVTMVAVLALAAGCGVTTSTSDFAMAESVAEPDTRPTAAPVVDGAPLQRFLSGSFASSDCDFAPIDELPVEPECGWLTRPLLGGTRNLEVELPVMVFRATGPDPAPDPIIYLHGGPSGEFLSELAAAYPSVVEPYLEDRDVIVFEQRGTGISLPHLTCRPPLNLFGPYDDEPSVFIARQARSCANKLTNAGIELDQFSRQKSADDVMVLARELGYEQFNLHGSSWGGLLAHTVMQLHPELVRSAILDSPLSIDTDLTGSMPGSFHEAMQAVQANCDRSESCRTRHGDIVERYIRLVDALDADPIELTIFADQISVNGTHAWEVELNGDELAYLLFGLLYSPGAVAAMPDMLADLEQGDTRLVERFASIYGWGWGFDFVFMTYMCTDIVPASSPDQVKAQEIGIAAFDRVDDAPDGRGHTAKPLCDAMKVGAPPAPAIVEQHPTTPTIVFSGSMDPITARSSGEALAASLTNGTFVFFDDLTHGITHDPCAESIAVAFIADPDAPVDRACADATTRPPFRFIDASLTLFTPNTDLTLEPVEAEIGLESRTISAPVGYTVQTGTGGSRWWRDAAEYDLTMFSVLGSTAEATAGEIVEQLFADLSVVEGGDTSTVTATNGSQWTRRQGTSRWGLTLVSYVRSDDGLALVIHAYAEELADLEPALFNANAG